MTLTPALCATLLKPVSKGHPPARPAGSPGSSGFNRSFDFCGKYEGIVGRSFGKPVRYLVIYGTIVACMVYFFLHLPTSFLPDEDQGFMLCQIQLPAGATMERTLRSLNRWSSISREGKKRSKESSP